MYLQVTGTKLSYMYDLCLCVCVSSYLWMPFMRLKHGPLLKGVLYCMLD